jgi:glycerophosphoryl diester phosphodiesterase
MRRTAQPLNARSDISILDTNVNELRFDQLRDFDLGAWKGEKWKGETIATLEEAFDTLPAGKQYLVEVKGGDHEIVPLIQACMDGDSCAVDPEQIIWIGFDLPLMAEVKKSMPHMQTYHVVGPSRMKTEEDIRATIDAAATAGLDGIDFPAIPTAVTTSAVDYAHDQGLVVAVWVFKSLPVSDTAESWQAMHDAGVDIFTSDLPPDVFDWSRQINGQQTQTTSSRL